VLADAEFSDPPAVVSPFGYGMWDREWQLKNEAQAKDEAAALLTRQAEAWSAGDLEAFCSVYADDALYVSPSGTTRGRAAILEQYRRRYPNRDAMGSLSLEVLDARTGDGIEVTPHGDAVPGRVHSISIVGRWRLTYTGRDPAEGRTLVVLRRVGDGWQIVQDASF